MKTFHFLLAILLLLFLQSCNNNEEKPAPPSNPEDYFQMEEDPEAKAAILGKWTKIAHGVDEDHIQWFEAKAKEYPIIEFLKNGEWKCYAAYASLPDETIYRYMISKTHIIRYPHSKDECFFVTEYRFIDKDRLKIKHIYGPISESMGTPFVYIYKRFLN